MAVSPEDYLVAADQLVRRLERDAGLSKREVDSLRRELVGDIKGIGARGTQNLRTVQFGRTRVLVPTGENFRKIGLTSRRVERRFSKFKLEWLSKEDAEDLVEGPLSKIKTSQFIRHSRRLARNARSFLKEIEELEPSLTEEVQATLRQIDDAELNLLKLEVRSWTRVDENLRRMTNGRMSKARARDTMRRFDVNRNLFNLSMVEHPKAVVRDIFARASEKMAQRVTKDVEELPRRAFVFVGAGPDSIERLKPGSRTARLLWRVFSVEDLDRRAAQAAGEGLSLSTWRGLGEAFGTPEWYVPIPPELVEDIEIEMRRRRRDFLGGLQESVDDQLAEPQYDGSALAAVEGGP